MEKVHIVIAGMLMCGTSVIAYNPWADMHKQFGDAEKTFAQMRKEIEELSVEASKHGTKTGYTLNAETKENRDGQSTYVVTATLPDFSKEDIKITVKVDSDDEDKKNKKSLEISSVAKKAEESKNKIKKNVKKSSVVQYSSLSMHSSSLVNGLGKSVKLENGELKMSIDLPSAVDEDSSIMAFDDEKKVLTITFIQHVKAPVKAMELKFKNEE